MPPEPPEFVPAGYRTLNLLGSGQTSTVYLAEHPQRGRVALKLPRRELKERPILKRMFENEVQFTLKLKHPNIVEAVDGYPTGPGAFLALEYCPGGTLDQFLLERGKVPLEQAFRLVLDVARGLEYSHSRNVLHRDVKPANVFLSAAGHAKLGDFGTGLFMTESAAERVGTAFYMAPELFQGESATAQSDIYSLGILAYEVIASKRPFSGDSIEALMMAHMTQLPQSLRHHRPDIDTTVVKVVATAMSREPQKRFRSVQEFVTGFATATGLMEQAPATPPSPTVGRASRSVKQQEEPTDEKKSSWGLGRWFGRKKS